MNNLSINELLYFFRPKNLIIKLARSALRNEPPARRGATDNLIKISKKNADIARCRNIYLFEMQVTK